MKITFQYENVDDMIEAKETEFGFNNNVGVIRNEEGKVVGFYDFYFSSDDTIKLQEIEIVFDLQGQGYGAEFIKELFRKNPEITQISGQATEGSVGFYERLGAWFYTSCFNCSSIDCSCHPDKKDKRSGETCDDYSENNFTLEREVFML